jgi:hypothetical protein
MLICTDDTRRARLSVSGIVWIVAATAMLLASPAAHVQKSCRARNNTIQINSGRRTTCSTPEYLLKYICAAASWKKVIGNIFSSSTSERSAERGPGYELRRWGWSRTNCTSTEILAIQQEGACDYSDELNYKQVAAVYHFHF